MSVMIQTDLVQPENNVIFLNHYKKEPVVDLLSREIYGYEVLSKRQHQDWRLADLCTLDMIGKVNHGLVGAISINMTSESIIEASDESLAIACSIHPDLIIEWVEAGCSAEVLRSASDKLKYWRVAFGIKISIDDMGKGQDGMERFLMVSPDLAKIDGSILHGARESKSYRRALKFLCGWCIDEDVPAIVEWIESKMDLDLAIESGSKFGQGFYFK